MTYSEIRRLFIDARECTTLELYLAEEGGSLPAEFYDSDDGSPPEITAAGLLTYIWEHKTPIFRDILAFSGLNQTELSALYGIPLRTLQNWATDRAKMADYFLMLLFADIINEKIYNV